LSIYFAVGKIEFTHDWRFAHDWKSWVAMEAHDFNREDKKKKENANRFNGLCFGKKRL